VNDIAANVVEEIDCVSHRQVRTPRSAAECLTENDAMGVGTDVFKKEANVFSRLSFPVKVVDELGNSFGSNEVEKELESRMTSSDLIHPVS
jgi:hypothetical protein